MVGQCDIARNEVDGGLLLSRDNFAVERASRTLAWCGAEAEAGAAIRDLESRYGEATFTMGVAVPLTRAAIAYRKHESQSAIDLLAPLTAFDRAPISEFWTEVRARALVSAVEGRQGSRGAVSEPHRASRRCTRTHRSTRSAHLGLARASALAGDVPAARRRTWTFSGCGRTPTTISQPLISARQEIRPAAVAGVRMPPAPRRSPASARRCGECENRQGRRRQQLPADIGTTSRE